MARVVQVTLSAKDLNALLAHRLPHGVEIVAVDREMWDQGIRLLLKSEDFPECPPELMPPRAMSTFSIRGRIQRIASVQCLDLDQGGAGVKPITILAPNAKCADDWRREQNLTRHQISYASKPVDVRGLSGVVVVLNGASRNVHYTAMMEYLRQYGDRFVKIYTQADAEALLRGGASADA